jgi:hypothetical protein
MFNVENGDVAPRHHCWDLRKTLWRLWHLLARGALERELFLAGTRLQWHGIAHRCGMRCISIKDPLAEVKKRGRKLRQWLLAEAEGAPSKHSR